MELLPLDRLAEFADRRQTPSRALADRTGTTQNRIGGLGKS